MVTQLDIVNPLNKDRGIDSFTEEECLSFFRFKKPEMFKLCRQLGIPLLLVCENGISCPGEHALCFYLYMRTYPMILKRVQKEFGREQSQLSRIDIKIRSWLLANHKHKVMGNVEWYEERFDMYADAVNKAIAELNINPAPGTVPPEVVNIGFMLDGCVEDICRLFVSSLKNNEIKIYMI